MNKIPAVDLRFLMLAGLLIFLPGLEALKNIFALLFVISWAITAKKNNYWGGRWLIIDSIFLLWILADIVISVNAVINHQLSGSGFRDIFRFVLLAWIISRTYFPEKKLTKLALIAVIACCVTLGYSYYSTHGVLKELHSVGNINHTAIYIVIAYSISLSLLLLDFKNHNKYQAILLIMSTVVLFYAAIDSDSRAAFGLIIAITLINLIYTIIKVKKLSVFVLFFGIIFAIGLFYMHHPPQALKRILMYENIFQDDGRAKLNNFSYYAFKKNPILGHGFGNYSQIKIEDIKTLVIKDLGVFNNELFLKGSHSHNLYYSYLVGGGLLIFLIFIWFWFYVFLIIIKLIKSKKNEWIFMGSVSVIMINLGIGFVNTTLHHEHAILTMFVLGLLISEYRQTLQIKE